MDRFGGVSRVLLSAALALVAAAGAVQLAAPGEHAVPLIWLLTAAIGLIAAWAYVRYRTEGLSKLVLPIFRRLTRTEQDLLSATSEDEVAARVSRELTDLLATDRAALIAVRHGRLVINRGNGDLVIDPGHERGFVRDVAVRRETVNAVRDHITGRPVALLGVPVVLDAIVVGVLVAVRDGDQPFTRTEEQVVARLAPVVADAIGEVRARRTAREAGDRDALTGLPGGHVFTRDLARMVGDRRRNGVAVALVRVDGIRRLAANVRDVVGNQIAAAVADVIRDQIRAHDTAYRLGHHEFGVILRAIRSDHAVAALDRLRQAVAYLTVPATDLDESLPVTISVGVAFTAPGNSTGALDLARVAVDEATAGGGDRVVLATENPFDHTAAKLMPSRHA